MAKKPNAKDWANFGFYKNQNQTLLAVQNSVGIVLMGDSITLGWTASDENPGFLDQKSYVNRGIGGQTSPQMLLRFRADVIDLHPNAVVILAGTNDIAENSGPVTLKMTMDNIASMAELARANGIEVVLCSVLPAYDYPWRTGLAPAEKIIALNAMIKAYADSNEILYVDYFSAMADAKNGLKSDYSEDGVHPNRKGYEMMKPILEKALKQLR